MKLLSFCQKIRDGDVMTTLALFTFASIFALLFAYFSEIFLSLTPCTLCLWQRIPYVAALFGTVTVPLGLIRLTLYGQTLAFAVGSGLALYHSGGERKLWALTACAGDFRPGEMSIDELSAKLSALPVVPCNQLQETLFGLSFTNYNLIFSLALTIIGIRAILLLNGRKNES